jgi:hypothetical protein
LENLDEPCPYCGKQPKYIEIAGDRPDDSLWKVSCCLKAKKFTNALLGLRLSSIKRQWNEWAIEKANYIKTRMKH